MKLIDGAYHAAYFVVADSLWAYSDVHVDDAVVDL